MCCGHENHHCGCSCGCGEDPRFGPAFWTEKEKIAWLEQHLEELREEVKTVEERIAALKREE